MKLATCPYCQRVDVCRHFIGWTSDRKMIDIRGQACEPRTQSPLRDDDIVIETEGAARVFRKDLRT